NSDQSVAEALAMMQQYDIEQIPVKEGENFIGAVSQNGLFKKVMQDAQIREKTLNEVLEAAIPVVAMNLPIDRLSGYITRENNAVLAKDDSGKVHIITQYDVLNALSKG